MRISEIQKMPTVIDKDLGGWHESVVRSYQILAKVKYYLLKKVPTEIILELIDEMELRPES